MMMSQCITGCRYRTCLDDGRSAGRRQRFLAIFCFDAALWALCVLLSIGGSVHSQEIFDSGIDTWLSQRHSDGISDGNTGIGAVGAPGTLLSEWTDMKVDINESPFGPDFPLLWFDVPPLTLAAFGDAPDGTAILSIDINNGADPMNLHRMTVDWLSGAAGDGSNGGNQISSNNIEGRAPDGSSSIQFGVNAELAVSATFANQVEGIQTVDVTADVLAWATGEANYGWVFEPTASQGGSIRTFDTQSGSAPQLILDFTPPPPEISGAGETYFQDFDEMGTGNGMPRGWSGVTESGSSRRVTGLGLTDGFLTVPGSNDDGVLGVLNLGGKTDSFGPAPNGFIPTWSAELGGANDLFGRDDVVADNASDRALGVSRENNEDVGELNFEIEIAAGTLRAFVFDWDLEIWGGDPMGISVLRRVPA